MSNLSARLEALLRVYAADCRGQIDDHESAERFRKGLQLLIADYGVDAVDAALDELPDNTLLWPSLH
jgi:hypothetical protein